MSSPRETNWWGGGARCNPIQLEPVWGIWLSIMVLGVRSRHSRPRHSEETCASTERRRWEKSLSAWRRRGEEALFRRCDSESGEVAVRCSTGRLQLWPFWAHACVETGQPRGLWRVGESIGDLSRRQTAER